MVAMPRSRQEKPPRTHMVGTLPATILSAALIVTLLLAAGCGRTSTRTGTSGLHPTATPAVTPTTAILPEAHLSWMVGKSPPSSTSSTASQCPMNISGQFDVGGINDPGDGDTAYTCEPSTSSTGGLAIWVTHDRAQHWTELAPLPSVGRKVDVGVITPDAADPSIVVVAVSWEPLYEFKVLIQNLISDFAQFVTFDGGAHWQPLQSPEPFLVLWLATYHGTTLASLLYSSASTHLWSSTDHLQTWHELPQTPSLEPFINPVNGELLALDTNVDNQGIIDESTDLGQHWTSQPVPSELYNGGILVSPPVVSQPWRLCGYVTPSGSSSSSTLMSSMDGGRTWTVRPQLSTAFYNTSKGLVVPEMILPVAVGADGTIYAVMEESDLQSTGGPPAGLYQLTPQATRWQPLTLPPGDTASDTTSSSIGVYTTDLPGSGILWTAVPSGLNMAPSGWAGPFPLPSV
jgi:hypothetical protein